MGNTERDKKLIKVYIAVEIILLAVIKTLQIMGAGLIQNGFNYAAIVCNTIVAAYYYKTYGGSLKDGHQNLIAYGLFTTLIADFFVTLISRGVSFEAYLCGIVAFIIVEIIYAVYLRADQWAVMMRIVLFAAGIIAIHRMGAGTPEKYLGVLNEVLILSNVIDVWTARKIHPPVLFRLGITLFFACDTSIMLRTLTSGGIQEAASFMVWIFYVPAQVLITLAYVRSCSIKIAEDD